MRNSGRKTIEKLHPTLKGLAGVGLIRFLASTKSTIHCSCIQSPLWYWRTTSLGFLWWFENWQNWYPKRRWRWKVCQKRTKFSERKSSLIFKKKILPIFFNGLFRFKGIAYIIVDGPKDVAVDTLAHVLAKSDHLLSGRKVRIEIYQVKKYFSSWKISSLHPKI